MSKIGQIDNQVGKDPI